MNKCQNSVSVLDVVEELHNDVNEIKQRLDLIEQVLRKHYEDDMF